MFKVAIVGYGNVGRGAELALRKNPDAECVGIFTRRNPEEIVSVTGLPVFKTEILERLSEHNGACARPDVLILCGGSACDLPQTAPEYLKKFNTVDSFDNHAKIPAYYRKMDETAKKHGKLCVVSVGWDPGLFSMARAVFSETLTDGKTYTFWGRGVSQGHSNAIKEIPGVKRAVAYTVPKRSALNAVKAGILPELSPRDKHIRECFIVTEKGADETAIENYVKTMPDYFADYDTSVHFIDEKEFREKHSGFSHGGVVIRTGRTFGSNAAAIELSLRADSNPEFTGGILVAYARAAARLYKEGKTGALTALDIPISYLSDKSAEDLRNTLL